MVGKVRCNLDHHTFVLIRGNVQVFGEPVMNEVPKVF